MNGFVKSGLTLVCVPKTLNPTVMVMKSAQDGT
ncbi:hypothetical protein SAMN05443248_0476 [Bradyrhizobium erythrophlei]|jgi:hypothetical protein|uniref:Uncharacterized protein n=1 Tax=Bradyrhizobium erythrophlei TaxID=1437360 RepID=A0A1M5HHE4_9BRAD|nr:hypothetical protein SAMN05443248_0476 [Bradyrhizobium erythrophlei]